MILYPRGAHVLLVALAFLGFNPTAHASADAVVLRVYAPAPIRPSAVPDAAAKDKGVGMPLVASLSMKFLKSLPQRTFVAQTPWYKDSVKFTGPLLRDVLAAAKVKGSVIHATALDDYRASIPFSDAQDYDVILAHQMNGETLTPKNKGPLFIVYPYDSKPELQTVRFYERSIWQLKSLQVE
jgi:hypothetical protein